MFPLIRRGFLQADRTRSVIHVTRGLLDVLLERAADADPDSVNVVLASTPAEQFEPALDVDDETPVLTHFYFPAAGQSVSAVFGIDLGTPAGRGRGRFLSHPGGRLALTSRDDLAGVVLVAVPPWTADDVAAFDRSGSQVEMSVLEATPPEESLP